MRLSRRGGFRIDDAFVDFVALLCEVGKEGVWGRMIYG